jgi:phage shock protein A
MIIDTDTEIHTLLSIAENIHDELESYEDHPNKYVTEEMQEAIQDYRQAHRHLESIFADARRERGNV